ncbi:hypothetical protein RB195_014352 [Necator americanus]|uniref:Uncharacterized protein n=1 Tax=Necator americanus TaxID=51031 RepID=A0ABR1DZN4_NECAM
MNVDKMQWLEHNETFIVCRERTNHVHLIASVLALVGSDVAASAQAVGRACRVFVVGRRHRDPPSYIILRKLLYMGAGDHLR